MPVAGPATDGVREFSGAAGLQQTRDPVDARVATLARLLSLPLHARLQMVPCARTTHVSQIHTAPYRAWFIL